MVTRIAGGSSAPRKKAPSNLLNPNILPAGSKGTIAPTGTGTVLKPVGAGTVLKPYQGGGGATQQRSTGGGGGGGGYVNPQNISSFGGGGGGSLAPQIAAPSEEDYLAGDAGYQTEYSALQSALQRFLADADFQRTNYNTDYSQSLRDLGYDEGNKAWNWNDKLTASGRGYQNQLDDFGARGMLQSSGYADAFQELQRLLGQQYDALSSNKTRFMGDLDNQTANYRAENTANAQAARAEALQRRAAQYML